MEKERISYIDMARGIGIILVVMGHVEYFCAPLRQWLSAFHMPLFFFLSGFLRAAASGERSFGEFVRRKGSRIMIPYLIFSALTLVVEVLWALWRGKELKNVLWYLYQTLCLQGFSALWFLPALFLGEVFFEGLHRLTRAAARAGILLAAWGGAVWLEGPEELWYAGGGSLAVRMLHEIFLMLLRVPVCAGFVGLGYLAGGFLRRRGKGSFHSTAGESVFGTLAGAALLGLTAWIAGKNGMTDLRSLNLGNPFLYLAGAAAGSWGVLLFCRGLEPLSGSAPGRFLRYLGANSLIIMGTHLGLRVLSVSEKLALWLGGKDPGGFWWKPLILVFVFLLEIPLIEVINRWFPRLAGRGRKG